MENKKGFTLVELLAVIAILAILVIIALPNVMSMFNAAKKNTFTTELKDIYKTAGQQWMLDSNFGNEAFTFVRYQKSDGSTTNCNRNSLELSGRKELNYAIIINKAGKVTAFYASDGTFQYYYENPDGIGVEDIGVNSSGANAVEAIDSKDLRSKTVGFEEACETDPSLEFRPIVGEGSQVQPIDFGGGNTIQPVNPRPSVGF